MAVDVFGFGKRLTRTSALALLLGSGIALICLITLAIWWTQLAVLTMTPDSGSADPCVVAYSANTDHAAVTFSAIPPRSICHWTVDGETRSVVLSEKAPALAWTVIGLGAAGIATSVGVVVHARRLSHRAATMEK